MYLALLITALLAATVLPLSSEALLIAALTTGNYHPLGLWGAATLGNVAGATINWTLGRYLLHFQTHPYFPISLSRIHQAQHQFNRYGHWSLLFSWLPIVGDPLTLVAGLMKMPLPSFLLWVTLGKGGRYALLILISSLTL